MTRAAGSETTELFERYRIPSVRDLVWLLTGPEILARTTEAMAAHTVDHAALREQALQQEAKFAALDADPAPLEAYLEGITRFGRLGRYFERLLEYGLRHILEVSQLENNIAVHGATRTLGELDMVFRQNPGEPAQHWEATVKFYICTGRTQDESQDIRRFFGTVVEDRLDIKLRRLFERQLRLSETPEAIALLEARGLPNPIGRVFLKGLFFYPSERDWRRHPCPPELAPGHPRGWWTTSSHLAIPQTSRESRWIRLGMFRWLSRHEGPIARDLVMTRSQLEDFIRTYFTGEVTPDFLRRRELTLAEVQIDELRSNATHAWVSELSRGHIVHADWPALVESVLAREAAEPVS